MKFRNVAVAIVILCWLIACILSGLRTPSQPKRSIIYFQDQRSSICFAESNHAVTIVPCSMVPDTLLEEITP